MFGRLGSLSRPVLAYARQKTRAKAIFSEVLFHRRSMSGGGNTFIYPQARRDETVVEDYHGTKVLYFKGSTGICCPVEISDNSFFQI